MGVSKALTKDKVIQKMNLRMVDGLKQASEPNDLAMFMAQLQAQQRARLAQMRAAEPGTSLGNALRAWQERHALSSCRLF